MSTEAIKVKEVEVTALLKKKMEVDSQFKKRFNDMVDFYWYRISQLKRNGLSEEEVYEKFEQFSQVLFHSGYFLMANWLEAVADDEAAKNEAQELLALSPNTLRNAMPETVQVLFEDEWKIASGSDFFMMWFVRNITFPTTDFIEQIRKDFIMQGCYQAVLDHALYTGKEIENDTKFVIGSPADIYFLSPQVYIMANSLGESHERWSMHFWANNKMVNHEIGSVILLKEQQDQMNFKWILNIQIQNLIVDTERAHLIQALIKLIPADLHKDLIIPYFVYQDVDVLVPTSKEEVAAAPENNEIGQLDLQSQ